MNVKAATEDHLEQMSDWMLKRGMPPYPPGLFVGASGFAIDGKAVCWLYPTSGAVALLENLVANPDASFDERTEAIDAVVQAALDEAKRLGCRYIFSTTTSRAVVKRAERFGFKKVEDNILLMADLGGE